MRTLIRKFIIVCLILLGSFYSCTSLNRYGNISKERASSYLWRSTNSIWMGSCDDVVELIEKGADVNYRKEPGSGNKTPLLNAVGILEKLDHQNKYTKEQIDTYELEAVKIVKYLAKKGANMHATTSGNHLNALHMAANGGREKIIPVLVDLGLDINSRNGDPNYGGTVLWHAINAGDLATVKAVVEAGADINLCLLDGNSPLDWAMAYANPKAKEALWLVPYRDQQVIAEYLQSIGAKHGKNQFKGMLYFDESKE